MGLLRWLPLLLFLPVDGKVKSLSIRIGGPRKANRWKYVSKFGFAEREAPFSIRAQLKQPSKMVENVTLQLEVYRESQWDQAQEVEPCERQKYVHKLVPFTIDASGAWGDWERSTFDDLQAPSLWYFATSDCNTNLPNYTHRLKFEFVAQQLDGSEFSLEMAWMRSVNVLALGGFGLLVWAFGVKSVAFSRSAGYVHPVIWMLASAILAQSVAQAMQVVHLIWFGMDGQGARPFEVLSEMLYVISQVIQTSILLLISLGYTLSQSKIGELDLMIPVCFMIGVLHLMLVGFGKLKDEGSYRYHENEGIMGWLQLVLRLLLYIWFSWAVGETSKEGGMKLRDFLVKFRIAGSVYFLITPTIFLFARQFSPHTQFFLMSVGTLVTNLASDVWLATLFLTRGEYFKVSSLSSSDLPGGVKVGVMKEE
jgi:hypothetical protein